MSFDALLRNTLVVKRRQASEPAAVDDYGQPVTAEVTVGTVAGLVQPRRAREVPAVHQSGAVVTDAVGFLRPLDGISTDCWIEYEGARYDIVAVPDAAGQGHHIELALRRVS